MDEDRARGGCVIGASPSGHHRRAEHDARGLAIRGQHRSDGGGPARLQVAPPDERHAPPDAPDAPVVATAPPHPPDAPPLSPNQDQVQTHTLTLNTWDRGDENENEGVRRASTSNSNSEQQQQRATATASHRADKNLITHVHKQRRPTQPLHGQPLHNILKRQNTRRKQHHVRMLLTEIVHV